ncbi:fungal hydrophobin [Neolentinus lepideus HHB14362 ss-1]|uniref:Hydrophobin n=1 Tax=Neolentinus lepideus HHB14362 ss-1 TaxID=1314782 RepID=A0A165VV68_9AGAM|nr:fungal hydrophobin [Neolentinus lepideus HHB14362 ss-1]
MFSFTKLAAIAAVATLAVATPTPQTVASCSTGSIQCCESVQSASSVSSILGPMGITDLDPNTIVGLGCSPLTILGLGKGSSCTANPVCCENDSIATGISVGCVPVSLN